MNNKKINEIGKFGASYQCLKCHYEWTGYAGPWDPFSINKGRFCPMCGNLYAVWQNHPDMFTKRKRGRK